ncbi:hypothetical protein QTP86_029523 [Hemibagrus guttatus]|nr:hypothetical protein QTP86_029523 [Hemibagrus guttatus]
MPVCPRRNVSDAQNFDCASTAGNLDTQSTDAQHVQPRPREYEEYQEIFSKGRATHLLPHRPWDCAINLLPNAMPSKCRIYPLSLPESRAMEEYIEEALSAGYIRPSTSPAAAGFFLVGKKDSGLRPCIDYRGLKALTVRYPYPLPLVPEALEQLTGAKIFTKLDLRSAYDILIYSDSVEAHANHVRTVLQHLLQNHLYVKLKKCEFHQSTITFLGYVLSPAEVEMDQVKTFSTTLTPCHLQTFSDNSAVVGCIRDGQKSEYRGLLNNFVDWCTINYLLLNVLKNKEMEVDFRRTKILIEPITIMGREVGTTSIWVYT